MSIRHPIKEVSSEWKITSDCEAPVLEIWGVWSTPSLLLCPGALWSGVVIPVPVRISSMSQRCLQIICIRLECLISYHHHHHHIVLAARISLTLSLHSSLSFIALGRSSGQQPVSSHSCWMYVRAGRPAFARPCVGIHKSTSLMSSSLLLQQCPACLVRLTWIDFVIGGRWPYSWCLVGCCCQDLKKKWYPIIMNIWRFPWCNGYCHRKWTWWHEFKSWTRLIAFHIELIPLGKIWIKLFSLQLWVNSRADWVLQPWWGN